MRIRTSRVIRLLRAGRFPTSLKINLSDPRVIEIAGLSGVDSVWLCHEHVPNDWLNLENQIRAARIYDMDTIVRVGRGSYSDYIRPFEAGANGIIVPHVTSPDEARQIVEWVRFHPIGNSALDGGNTDGLYGELPIGDYIERSNEERLIILQIESPEALDNLDDIAAVDGYNGLLFGPGDFSHRLGKAGHFDAPEVVRARRLVASAARNNGKFAMSAGLIAPFDQLVAEGHQLFNIGADIAGLSAYLRERLQLVSDGVTAPAARSPYA